MKTLPHPGITAKISINNQMNGDKSSHVGQKEEIKWFRFFICQENILKKKAKYKLLHNCSLFQSQLFAILMTIKSINDLNFKDKILKIHSIYTV